MNTKTTMTVALIALLLGAYVLVFETDLFDRQITSTRQIERETAGQSPQTGQPLLATAQLPADRVKRISIELAGEKPFVIQRAAGDKWRQIEPVTFALESYRVTDIINSILALRQTSTIPATDSASRLDKMGLAPPRAVIKLSGEGMADVTLSLGSRTGAGRAYIALSSPDKIAAVQIVNDQLHQSLLAQPLRNMRATNLVQFTPGSVQSVTLTSTGDPLTLSRKDGRWMLTGSLPGRADRAAVETLATTISTAVVEAFVQDNPANLAMFGLDKPQYVLSVDTIESVGPVGADDSEAKTDSAERITTHKLAIGAAQDLERTKFFAMFNDVPAIFTLRKTEIDRLARSADDLRDSALTTTPAADVKQLDITAGPQKLSFIRDQGTWNFADPKPAFALDSQRMDQLILAIFSTRATGYVPAASLASAPVLATVTLHAGSGDPDVLTLHDHAGQPVVLRQGESVGSIVTTEAVDPLRQSLAWFRDRTVLDIAADNLRQIVIERTGEHPARYQMQRESAAEGSEPAGKWVGDISDDRMKALTAALHPLRAVRWLDKAQAPAMTPAVTLTLTLSDGKTHELRIDPIGRIAQLQGSGESFEIPQEMADLLMSELRDTTVLKLDVEAITSVTSAGVTIERTPDGKFRATDGSAVDEAKAAALFDTLAGLSAERFVTADRAAGEPTHTLIITTSGGASRTLKLWAPAGGTPIGQIDQQTFTLSPESMAQLTTPR
jgi:hypothetical protein